MSRVERELAVLKKQGAGNEIKRSAAPKAGATRSAPTHTEKEEGTEEAEARPSHTSRAKAARASTKSASGEPEKAKQETAYAVTGMIGGRGFITKRGGNDVNPDLSVAAGETLPDGRKITMVDQKLKRVWLSDGKYISTGE